MVGEVGGTAALGERLLPHGSGLAGCWDETLGRPVPDNGEFYDQSMTDATGRVSITIAPNDDLFVLAEGYRPWELDITFEERIREARRRPPTSGAVVRFEARLQRPAVLHGRVSDPAGLAIPESA